MVDRHQDQDRGGMQKKGNDNVLLHDDIEVQKQEGNGPTDLRR